MEQKTGEVVETGTYELLANLDGDFQITGLVLHGANGAKRIWSLKELSEKEIKFDIKKFS